MLQMAKKLAKQRNPALFGLVITQSYIFKTGGKQGYGRQSLVYANHTLPSEAFPNTWKHNNHWLFKTNGY